MTPATPATPASLLARGLKLPVPDAALCADIPADRQPAVCPLTTEPLTAGYPAMAIIPGSTGEWLGLLRGNPHAFLSGDAASVLQNDWNLGGRAILAHPDGTTEAYNPLIAPTKPAKPGAAPAEVTARQQRLRDRDGSGPRPLWSDLVRDLWPRCAGCPALFLLATDPKKRVWPQARVGPLGEQTPVLVFDNSRAQLRSATVNWPVLLETLDFVEEVYAAGFSKAAIEHRTLYAETKALAAVGFEQTRRYEQRLAAYRRQRADELLLCVIIAVRRNATAPATTPSVSPSEEDLHA